MGRDLAENYAAARTIFDEADDALGFSLSKLCFEGPAEELQLTENTQPAILTVSVATFESIKSEGFPPPSYVAGHSLGEYSALVCGGAISLADAVKTVRARGRYMQEAVPVGTGAMAAVIGVPLDAIESACSQASGDQICAPANINSPNQIVIAGNAEAVDRAIDILRERGAKRLIKLNVSAPFHCGLMMPAQERLAADLAKLHFKNSEIPIVTNVDAQSTTDAAELRAALVRQVSSPVRWQASVELLIGKGVNTFIEVGPGKVLTGLLRQINRAAAGRNVEDSASLAEARQLAV